MDPAPVTLRSGGIDETVLDAEPDDARRALDAALTGPDADRAAAVRAVVARWPGCLDAWARLGDAVSDDVEAYACYRVGYHRGLDRLRGAGWRGSGYVRWSHPENRGFLRALAGLHRAARVLGEDDEADRTDAFLHQLEPGWDGIGEAPGQ